VPRVSVLLPVFNAEAYLDAALDSIHSQTFEDFEVIAVDDGSTDASAAILDKARRRDSRVIVVSQPQSGIVVALNRAIEEAGGEYFARMDADDIARGDRLLRQVAFLDANPACVCVGSRYRMIGADGRVLGESRTAPEFRQTDLGSFPPYIATLPHPSIMARADAMRRVGGYRAGFPHAEDTDLFLRLSGEGLLDCINEPLLDYRIHEGSISAANLIRQTDSACLAILSAMIAKKDGKDPWNGGEAADRRALSESVFGPAFRDLFECYCSLRLTRGYADRGLVADATGQGVRTIMSTVKTMPSVHWDRRSWLVLGTTLRVLARLYYGKLRP